MDRNKRAALSTVANSIGNYVGLGISILSIPVLLRYLGKEDYGLLLTVLSFNGIFSLGTINILGGSKILIAQASGLSSNVPSTIKNIFKHGLFLSVLVGISLVILTCVYFVVTRLIFFLPDAALKTESLVVLLIVQVLITLIGGNYSNLFEAMQDSYIQQIYFVARRVVSGLLMLCVAFVSGNVVYVLGINILVILLEYFVVYLHAKKRYHFIFEASSEPISKDHLREQISTGSKSFIYEIASLIKVMGVIWAISLILGSEFVPDFTVTRTIVFTFVAIFLNYSRNLQPAFGEAFSSGDTLWIQRSLRSLFKRNFLLPLFLVFILLPGVCDFIAPLIKIDIDFKADLFLLIVIFTYFNYLNQSSLNILNGINKQKVNMILYLVDAVLSFCLGLAALHFMGDLRLMILISTLVSICFFPFHLSGLNKYLTSISGILETSFYKKYALLMLVMSCLFLLYKSVSFNVIPYLEVTVYFLVLLIAMTILIPKLKILNYSLYFRLFKKTIRVSV